MSHQRGNWSSRVGFILATSGAAIGLGNIQRFPYLTAKCGGSAFVFVYLLCVIFFALPLILNEFAIGRFTQRNPVGAIEIIRGNSPWKIAGALGIFVAFGILCYYSVVGGWAINYFLQMLAGSKPNLQMVITDPFGNIGFMAVFLLICAFIVSRGIKKGIERYSKIFMPILFCLMLFLVLRAVTLPGSFAGVQYYLHPDFSALTPKSVLYALGQAFFSLCIGEGVLLTYGSYTSKKENLVASAGYIVLFDTLIALVAGLIVFPALAAFNQPIEGGVGLTFSVLPKIFEQLYFGNILGASFFLLLSFAALTTGIALLEIPVTYLIDSKKWGRKKAVLAVTLAAFFIGIFSALSKGAVPFLTNMTFLGETGFYDIMDFIWGGLGMPITGFLLAIFTGYVWGVKHAFAEIKIGAGPLRWYENTWKLSIRFFAPGMILLIFLSALL